MERHDDLLRQGIAAAEAQDKARARTLLRQAVALQDDQELSWLWLASVAESQTEIYQCMDRILRINPLNEQARDWIVAAQKLGLRPTGRRPRLEDLVRAEDDDDPVPERSAAAGRSLHETQPVTPGWGEDTAVAADATVFLANAADLFGDAED